MQLSRKGFKNILIGDIEKSKSDSSQIPVEGAASRFLESPRLQERDRYGCPLSDSNQGW